MLRFGPYEAQQVLCIVALGPEAILEYLECDTDDQFAAFYRKWFGSDNLTTGEVKQIVREKLRVKQEG